eukprot:snap_masked-scaffold_30-processed-gene-1.30-mRNA-1 protein AED:1.00 eAED:1.00 QI:0/0/0/0/1/1/2/0/598
MAFFSGFLTLLFSYIDRIQKNFLTRFENSNVYFGGLAFIVGFVVVYRAQLAIGRYTTAQKSYYSMVSKLSDMAMFAKVWVRGEDEESNQLLCSFLRWIQLYHELGTEEIQGFEFSAKYPRTHITTKEAHLLLRERKRPLIVMGWILNSVAKHRPKILCGDAVVSRIYVLASEVNTLFNEARRISETPFPFPFAQITVFMISIWGILTPMVIAAFLPQTFGFGPIVSFCGTWMLFAVNESASQLEQPFDDAENDLPILYYSLAFYDDIQGLKNFDTPEITSIWYSKRKREPPKYPKEEGNSGINTETENDTTIRLRRTSSNPSFFDFRSRAYSGSQGVNDFLGRDYERIDIADTFRSLFKHKKEEERMIAEEYNELQHTFEAFSHDEENKDHTIVEIKQPDEDLQVRRAKSVPFRTPNEENVDEDLESQDEKNKLLSEKANLKYRIGYKDDLFIRDEKPKWDKALSRIEENISSSESIDSTLYNTVNGVTGKHMVKQLKAELDRLDRKGKVKNRGNVEKDKKRHYKNPMSYNMNQELSKTVRLRKGIKLKDGIVKKFVKGEKPVLKSTNFKPTDTHFSSIDERSPFTLLRRQGLFDRVR